MKMLVIHYHHGRDPLKTHIIALVLICALLLVFKATAATSPSTLVSDENLPNVQTLNLENMDHAIFTEPWLSLQKISQLQSSVASMTRENKLWWLVRKAQCENLLYFFTEFEQTLTQVNKLITEQTPLEIQARISHFQGLSLQRSGGYKQSRDYFKKAMKLSKQGRFHHVYMKAKQQLAYTYSLSELFETSLTDMQEANIEAFALNDAFLIALINETYGIVYRYMHQYEKSLQYWNKALDTYERLGYPAHVADATYGIAATYRYWKKYDLAIDKFKLYQQKVSYSPNENLIYYGVYGLGMTLAEQGTCQEALKIIEQALAFEGIDNFDTELYKRRASCLIKLNQLDQAEQALINVTNLYLAQSELAGNQWQLEVDKISGQLAYARGNYQQGYQYLDAYYQSYTDALVENWYAQVINIRDLLEIDRQGVESALSKQRDKAERLEVELLEQTKQQQYYFVLFLTLLFAVFISAVIYRFYLQKKMTALATADDLSGLHNRRYIFEFLEKMLPAMSVNKGSLAIFIVDIDDFKSVNDSYGHFVGDIVIKKVAKIVAHTLRIEDRVGRISGEEFLCVLPRTEFEQSELIAQRIRKNIAEHQFYDSQQEKISVTVSIGISHFSENIQDYKTLYFQANKALHTAKNAGKNQVTTFE